jgi:acyl-CoA reductase-like NAD-dependent aldehyde dehydrogenase
VLCVIKFTDTDDVIARANATPYGLAAAVWTGSIKTAQRVSRRLRAGTVWVSRRAVCRELFVC